MVEAYIKEAYKKYTVVADKFERKVKLGIATKEDELGLFAAYNTYLDEIGNNDE